MSGDSGWNSIIHRPQLDIQDWDWDGNDGEPERELPSTVDMDAIKDGGNWNPVTGVTAANSEDDSDSDDDSSGESDGSGSCSDSNSDSDNDSSDSESNSDCSSDNSEQTFSIRETNFDEGKLKLKISMKVPRKEDLDKLRCDRAKRLLPKKIKNQTAKTSDCSSEDSDSSLSQPTTQCSQMYPQMMQQAHVQNQLHMHHIAQQLQQQSHHMNMPTLSEQLQDPSQASTQPLEEINQEDLAAILPDAAFDGFEDSESGRLVSKAIERMSLGADSDSSENVNERNPVPVYSSSLLQQFVEKTALLSEPRKRRTGGVSVKQNVMGKQRETEYVSSSNVSPDSGIQSVDNSPLHLLNPVSPLATQGSITTANVITSPSRNGMNTKFIAPSSKALNVTSSSTSSVTLLTTSTAATVALALAAKSKSSSYLETVTAQAVKRKPGRPAKVPSASSTTTTTTTTQQKQSRGPGRPAKPKPNVPPKNAVAEKSKEEPYLKKAKVVVSQCKSPVKQPELEEQKLGSRKAGLRKSLDGNPTKQTVPVESVSQLEESKVSLSRKKCLNKPTPVVVGKRVKEIRSTSEEPTLCKRMKRESKVPAKYADSSISKPSERTEENSNKPGSKKSSKENRLELSKRQQALRKTQQQQQQQQLQQQQQQQQQTSTRRVLKENKTNKKANIANNNNNDVLEANGINVQNLVSLPVINPMKISDTENSGSQDKKSRKSPNDSTPFSEKSHHHHHHKHKRRIIAPKTPIRVDPEVGQELERLINEFSKLCSLGKLSNGVDSTDNNKINNNNSASSLGLGAKKMGEILPQIFKMKKTSKKRKGEEISSIDEKSGGKVQKRRTKKEKSTSSGSNSSNASVTGNESSNPNEQRLPLKKRHYHVFSSVHDSSQEPRPEDEEDDEDEDDDEEEEEDEDEEIEEDENEEEEEEQEPESSSTSHVKEPVQESVAKQDAEIKEHKVKEQKVVKEQKPEVVDAEPAKVTAPTPVPMESKKKIKENKETSESTTVTAPVVPEKPVSEKEPVDSAADKSQSEADSQPRRKKKIVKDLRVTVTKIPVENNHIIDKIEKLEKMCAGDKTVKPIVDKSPKPEKPSSEKVSKSDKLDKSDIRIYEHCQRSERIAKNKLLKEEKLKEEKLKEEAAANKSVKKESETSKVLKKDVESSKTMKKDIETGVKTAKKDAEFNKLVKKDTETVDKVIKKENESNKLVKKDNSEPMKQPKKDVDKLPKKDLDVKKKEIVNKLDLIKDSEVVLHKTEKCEITTSSLAAKMIKKKIRRRKTINRTGFPTLKKKKKKTAIDQHILKEELLTVVNNKLDKKPIVKASNIEIDKFAVENKEIKEKDKEMKEKVQEVKEKNKDIKEKDKEVKEKNKETKDKEVKEKDREVKEKNKEVTKKKSDAPLEKEPVKIDKAVEDEKVFSDTESVQNMMLEENLHVCSVHQGDGKDSEAECDGAKPCDKLCPVKYEQVQDSRMYDENATLEESLERCHRNQKIAVLSEENLRKLECTNSQVSVKLEVHACLNNNNHRRARNSASPCALTIKNLKRLRNDYDTESGPSSDVASEDHEKQQPAANRTRKKQPRWKKRYLQAGLFSDYFKEDEPRKPSNIDSSKNKMIYDPAEHPHGLLPPPYHCGKFLRQRKIPFQLPYDLWWMHTHSRLPGRDLVPSWNYRKIRSNVYYDVKPTMYYEAQACECKPEAGCGDDCINRMVFSECSPQLCPCTERCKNQRIQKHDWAPGLQKFMTESKGWGVRTNKSIKNGEFILEYVGEVVSEREFKSRMATRYANDTHHYCLHLDGGLVIDGHRMGGDGRFVNHSCEPNCEMQKWSVLGLPRMALFALRNIGPGEELTYDYNFALFNPSEGQECRCGSDACRGVIGGKSQRVARPDQPRPNSTTATNNTGERRSVGRPRKNARKNEPTNAGSSKSSQSLAQSRPTPISILGRKSYKSRKIGPEVKPLSNQQRLFVLQHRCFLIRNIEKIKRQKVPNTPANQNKGAIKVNAVTTVQATKDKSSTDPKTNSESNFLTHLSSLTNAGSRTVRTRRLAQAQDDPELNKTAKLAKVLKDLYSLITSAKDENEAPLCTPFTTLPPKRKLPEYYEKVLEPIDLTTIEQNIENGQYKTAEQFDQDVIKMFDNNVRFYGRTSEIGIAAARLRKLYLGSKVNFVEAITEATGLPPTQSFLPPRGSTAGEEDVIRCICGLHRDEGLMIQCERCLVWQHCDCVKADTSAESYLCERCQPREVDYEIPLENEEKEEGKKDFVTLMRGDLQLRVGDTVYVLRDTPDKHTYKTIAKLDYEQMDIFRIERLWKDNNGERFVFGHHYLRPHETFHEPTRKFYENEVVCAPLYEAVSCDLVAGRCWVLDPHTFCKGRPVNAPPEHIYTCEYRVDRQARLFTKVARSRHQVCTKPYAFESFPQRIKHYRTYLPHSLEGVQCKKSDKDKKKNFSEAEHSANKAESRDNLKLSNKDQTHKPRGRKRLAETAAVTEHVNFVLRENKKKRLNSILVNLLDKMPNKDEPLDLSNLLERNRRNRKRPCILNP